MVLSLINKRTGKRFALDEPTTLLGRDPKLRMCLNDVGVSRRHAVLLRTQEGVVVNDLGSRNGVFVNGVAIGSQGATPLRRGDRITIGATTFLLEEGEAQIEEVETFDQELEAEFGTIDELVELPDDEDASLGEIPGLAPTADTGVLQAVLDDLEDCFQNDDLETLTLGVLSPGDSGELILDPDPDDLP